MHFSDVLVLVKETSSKNSLGDVIKNPPSRRTVFGNEKSVRQSEYYQASAQGLKPEITFEIHSLEYAEEKLIEFNQKEYRILRSYKKGEIIELICSGVK